MTIPASQLAAVFPSVLSAGGAALALSGLILTNSTAVPIGTVPAYSTPADVAAFFGDQSVEYDMAQRYFLGPNNSTAKPGALLFSQYATAPVSGYLRSASFKGAPLSTITGIASGTLTVTVDGAAKTSTAINLSTATSYSNAATLIQAGFTGGGAPVVTFDAQRQAFLFASPTTGANSVVSFASGALAAGLRLTSATAAVVSAGSAAMVPASAMLSITNKRLDWASFTTTFEPLIDDKIAFATWTSLQSNRFVYTVWDTDPQAIVQDNAANFGARAKALDLSGYAAYSADLSVANRLGVSMTDLVRPLAAFSMGIAASLDFGALNGRTTFAFRSQDALITGVDDASVANTLKANGYNFYGDYATSSQSFKFLQPGQIGGDFLWLDSYYNQIWMNAAFQQAMMILMEGSNSIPYNPAGYSSIESALLDPIQSAVTFGAIATGVTLTNAQINYVNSSTGKQVANIIASRGWYLDITDPGGQVRQSRGSPNMRFYYADGGSVQTMQLASTNIQ